MCYYPRFEFSQATIRSFLSNDFFCVCVRVCVCVGKVLFMHANYLNMIKLAAPHILSLRPWEPFYLIYHEPKRLYTSLTFEGMNYTFPHKTFTAIHPQRTSLSANQPDISSFISFLLLNSRIIPLLH